MTKGFNFSLPATVVVLAICYIYFTTVFIFIDRWFGLMSSPGLMHAVVFTAVALMCVFNYAVAILRDPGRIPANYMPDIEDDQNPMHEIKRKVLGPNIFCWVCPTSRHIDSGLNFRTAYLNAVG